MNRGGVRSVHYRVIVVLNWKTVAVAAATYLIRLLMK
jgi:hypothetical protein